MSESIVGTGSKIIHPLSGVKIRTNVLKIKVNEYLFKKITT